MKISYTKTFLFIGGLWIMSMILAWCQNQSAALWKNAPQVTFEKATDMKLSVEQIQTLSYLIQEEKLAKDVYTTLYNQWGNKKFANILSSEDKHRSQLDIIFTTYNLTNPIVSEEIWVFANEELSQLYQQLIIQGKQSEADALQVGITIEQKDIQDIESMMKLFENYPDITVVLQNLLAGSQRHLQAFQK